MKKKGKQKSASDIVEHLKEKLVSSFKKTGTTSAQTDRAVENDFCSEEKDLLTVTAPLTGIFYSAPSSESPPYVEAGGIVRKGQILCIIEAMKLMNEIQSEINGAVIKILVENGQSVEKGQSLFIVKLLS